MRFSPLTRRVGILALLGASLPAAAQAVDGPAPAGVPWWAWSLMAAAAAYVLGLVGRAAAAYLKARADALEEVGRAELADGDPANDPHGREAIASAKGLRAVAGVIDDAAARVEKGQTP